MKTGILLILISTCMLGNPAKHAGIISPSAGENSASLSLLKTKEYLTGRVDYYSDTNFIEIPKAYAYREKMFLLRETYDAWYRMYQAAKSDGIDLKIISATRTHTEQRWIWEDKWEKPKYQSGDKMQKIKNILEFSAMPGTSRHHWGTEVDLNSTSEAYFASGYGKKVYDWLNANACSFGFCQVYDAQYAGRRGHGEEKWHWSYFPVSKHLPEYYNEIVTYHDISGFSGCEYASALNVIEDYVTSIRPECCN